MTFKEEFWAEWARLNPMYSTANDGVKDIFVHAFHETLHGYFAPFRMLLWLLKAARTRIFS